MRKWLAAQPGRQEAHEAEEMFMPVRTPVSRRLLVLLVVAGATTAACGHEQEGHRPDTATVRSSSSASVTPSAAAHPSTDAPAPDRTQAARQKAESDRRQAAPPGVTITLSPSWTGIAKGSEHFGNPVAQRGDVTVYVARRDKDGLRIPVEVVNSGRTRAFYRFRIRITGPGGFKATADAAMDVVGLYPGTSWPTELTVRDPGHTPPAHPHITIESIERNEFKP
jgi:hypothetical protein